jgi:tRNA(adenine34) deaminase
MRHGPTVRFSLFNPFLEICLVILLLCSLLSPFRALAEGDGKAIQPELDELEKRIASFVPSHHHRDDSFILVTLREAVAAMREGSGGIGACLVHEQSGAIVEVGHNRQFMPHFRSDMHAEMDLLNRYEEKKNVKKVEGVNPRQVDGLVLYSSLEPCPMCLTRILNAGLKKTCYAAADPNGGMVQHISSLPPFWRDLAENRTFAPADCSPELSEIATRLFKLSRRELKKW